MAAIRVIFDGRTFVPQEAVSLPNQAEALVLIDNAAGQQELDGAIRAYYQDGADADDEAWGRATAGESHRAWDED